MNTYFYLYITQGMFHIRFFGYGFYIKNVKKRRLLFSERNGMRGITILNWHVGPLKPNGAEK